MAVVSLAQNTRPAQRPRAEQLAGADITRGLLPLYYAVKSSGHENLTKIVETHLIVKKAFTNAIDTLFSDTFRMYVTSFVDAMSWKVALALALMICLSVTQGAQLLLLVPMLQLVGLDTQQGSVGQLSEFVSSVFAALGVRPTLTTVLGIFLFFTTLLALLTRWQTIFNFKLGEDFAAFQRRRLYRAIANTEWLTFSRSRSSDFAHALTTEIDRIGAATNFLLRVITDVILLSIYILLALRLSATMTALAFVTGLVLLLLLRRKARAAQWTGEDISLATNGLYSAAIEHLGGMKTTKSYGVEERNTDIFSRLANRVARMQVNGVRNYAETAFWFGVGSAVILSVILYVSFEMLSISAAGLILLLFLFNRMMPLFNNTQQSYQQFLNALPAFAGVVEMKEHCEATAEPKPQRLERIEFWHGIRFERVSFAYDKASENATITELDMLIPAGKTTAIVGASGAGKSTVADLVMGLIAPDRGRIVVDGTLLNAERIKSWRHRIGYVAQETFLFNATIRANLLWACPEANDDQIHQALKLASAEEFVFELPHGLETVLGDRGVRLSGGERQRLALARALLRQPSLLILDEATSALDSENERRVQSAIEHLHGQMTILIITHRLSTIREADIIYVLERGRLVESGNWSTLASKRDGRLNRLARAQGVGHG